MVDVDDTVSQAMDKVNELSGKYLTFKLGNEEYGLEILKVREIIGLMDITSVPRTPAYVRGVINLRGKVIPVVDLRVKFGMRRIEDSEQTCIIVVEVTKDDRYMEMGVLVDTVSEVLDITGEDIEEAPSFGASVDTAFILGMAKADSRVTILLNIQKVVTAGDVVQVDETVSGAATDMIGAEDSSGKGKEDIEEEKDEDDGGDEKTEEIDAEEAEDNSEELKECVESVT